MADSFTTRLRALLMGTNEHKNVWGADLNGKTIQLFDDAIAGWANIDLSSSNATLTTGNGATDEARMAVIRAYGSGTTTRTITIPSVEKCYKVKNDYGGRILIKTAAGVGVTVLPNTMAEVWCNNTECYRAWVSGWGLLSTVSTTSGTSKNIVFTVTGQAFTRALLVGNATMVGAAPLTLTINGPSGASTAVNLNASVAAIQGEIEVDRLTGDIGTFQNRSGILASSPATVSITPNAMIWRSTGGITDITLTTGSTFNGGSIEVYMQ